MFMANRAGVVGADRTTAFSASRGRSENCGWIAAMLGGGWAGRGLEFTASVYTYIAVSIFGKFTEGERRLGLVSESPDATASVSLHDCVAFKRVVPCVVNRFILKTYHC
jgi:hypothetical protein